MCGFRGPGIDAEGLEGFDRSPLERPRVRLGVQLDTVGAGRGREPDGVSRGIDKEAHTDAEGLQFADDLRQSRIVRRRPAGLAGYLAGNDRHERALVGPHLLNERDQLRSRIPFDVVFDPRPEWRQHARDVPNVPGRDVPAVGPRMHGDSLHPGVDARTNRVEYAGEVPSAGVADGGDLVDVD